MQKITCNQEFIDFLKDFKQDINIGRSRDDLKTILNKKINSLSDCERQPVSDNEQTKELCDHPHKFRLKLPVVPKWYYCSKCGSALKVI